VADTASDSRFKKQEFPMKGNRFLAIGSQNIVNSLRSFQKFCEKPDYLIHYYI
jgi:hypothetical protein